MRVGIVLGRIGGIDGVALETEKWITVLERMGQETRILTGALEGPVSHATVLPELAFDHPTAIAEQEQAFLGKPADEQELLRGLEDKAERICQAIERWVAQERIDVVLSENANAIPLHLSMGMGLQRFFERSGLPGVAHDHDFAWERGERYVSPYAGVNAIVERCFPVTLPNVRHAVINSAAKQALRERCGVEDAVVVPNVMDFDEPIGVVDDYNADLRRELGLAPDDWALFQVTRIVRRKGIDIAIELIHRLADPRAKLIITGTSTDDRDDSYTEELERQVEELGLKEQVLFAGHRFDNCRRRNEAGEKVYALWDAYAQATACTYFSLYEGFGNAFVEAVAAGVPIFVNNYEPVYWPDIGSKGFRTVMIEGGKLTEQAVEETRRLLLTPELRTMVAEHNFELGREHFSYQALRGFLERLFDKP